jgi:monolysocardiolipin acyltransferase
MWLTGFDKLMPEHRVFPYNYFPKLGIRLGVTFGDPISVEEIMAALNAHSHVPLVTEGSLESKLSDTLHPGTCVGHTALQAKERFAPGCGRKRQADAVRSDVTAIIQRAVEALGRQVSGNLLNNSRS